MGLLCAAAAAAPAGKCACMGFCGENLSEVMGDVRSVPFSLSAPLLCQTIVAIFCGNFEQFANIAVCDSAALFLKIAINALPMKKDC